MRDHTRHLMTQAVRVIGGHNGKKMVMYRGSGWFSSLIDMGKRAFGSFLNNGQIKSGLNVIGNTAHNFVNENKQKLIDAAKDTAVTFAKEQGTNLAQNLSKAKDFNDVKGIIGSSLQALPEAAKARVSDKLNVLGKEAEKAARSAYANAGKREADRAQLDEMPFMDGEGVRRMKRGPRKTQRQYTALI